jgi:hypothetical protein
MINGNTFARRLSRSAVDRNQAHSRLASTITVDSELSRLNIEALSRRSFFIRQSGGNDCLPVEAW